MSIRSVLARVLPDVAKNFIWKHILNQFFYRKILFKNKFQITKNVDVTYYGNKARFEFFQSAQYYLQVNRLDGVYAEFGSHGGNTFRNCLNSLGLYGKPNKISHFYSFDSFEGMPEPEGIDKQKIWVAGMNVTGEQEFQGIMSRDKHRVTTVRGFYEDSLKGFSFPENHLPVLAYIDCDYYSSTKVVLDFLVPYLRHGIIVAFDDWDCYFSDNERGQRLAFNEWAVENSSRFDFVPFRIIGSGGMSFIVHEKEKIGSDFEG